MDKCHGRNEGVLTRIFESWRLDNRRWDLWYEFRNGTPRPSLSRKSDAYSRAFFRIPIKQPGLGCLTCANIVYSPEKFLCQAIRVEDVGF